MKRFEELRRKGANATAATRERAKSAQPLKVGGNFKRAAKLEKLEKDPCHSTKKDQIRTSF